jgi:hypothetical protein
VAKGVGERSEQPEGLYLGCGPRYSRRKRGCRGSPWSRGGEKIMVMGADVCVLASFFLLHSTLALLCDDIQKMAKTLFHDALVPLIKIIVVYLKKFRCLIIV